MNPQAAQQQYLRTKVLTATAEQLQLMLFDGAIRFCEKGRVALEAKNWEQSYKSITDAQAIVTQLLGALKTSISPDLCDKLKALYVYAYKKLVDANLNHKIESLDEAVKVLKYQRETWVMLMEQLSKQKAAAAAATMDIPAPDSRMEASISMQG
jgi:flagellar secretion chaperone FliS